MLPQTPLSGLLGEGQHSHCFNVADPGVGHMGKCDSVKEYGSLTHIHLYAIKHVFVDKPRTRIFCSTIVLMSLP